MLRLFYSEDRIEKLSDVETKATVIECSPINVIPDVETNAFFHEQKNGHTFKNYIDTTEVCEIIISEDELHKLANTFRLLDHIEKWIAQPYTWMQHPHVRRGQVCVAEILEAPKWSHPFGVSSYNEVSIKVKTKLELN